MSKYPQTAAACIAKFIDDITIDPNKDAIGEFLTKNTVETYEANIKIVVRHLEESGRETLPHKITEDDIRYLLGVKWVGYAIRTRKTFKAVLSRYCAHFGNPVVKKVKIRFPHDMRPNVRRLNDEQANTLWRHPMNPLQRLVIMLTLFMGLRRTEVLRLKIDCVKYNSPTIMLMVNGKGGLGGKPRLVPLKPKMIEIINAYIEHRNELIAAVLKKNPNATIPDSLIVYKLSSQIREYGESGLDGAVCEKLSETVGFKFSNHDLRRTLAQKLYRKGAELRTIADILGHETIADTEKYIGIVADKMADAIEDAE